MDEGEVVEKDGAAHHRQTDNLVTHILPRGAARRVVTPRESMASGESLLGGRNVRLFSLAKGDAEISVADVVGIV